jgi:hypothetical protein
MRSQDCDVNDAHSEKISTHSIIFDADLRHCVGIRPNDVLCHSQPILFEVLDVLNVSIVSGHFNFATYIAEALPLALPLHHRPLRDLDKLSEVLLVRSNRLLYFAQLLLDSLELFALYEVQVGGV